MPVEQAEEWTKSYLIRPENNIISHEKINAKKFVPSYDRNCTPTSMTWILGWEYGRVWLKDRCLYINKRDNTKAKKIENDFSSWLKKHDPKSKKIVNPTGKQHIKPKTAIDIKSDTKSENKHK